MKIQFIAGFGPVAPDKEVSLRLYRDTLGIPFSEQDGTATNALDGARLSTAEYRSALADGIHEGIRRYIAQTKLAKTL